MIALITIAGLGSHVDTTLKIPDPMGHTDFAGHSEAGKTMIMHAVSMCLWGVASNGKPFPVEAIRDGSEKATMEIVTAKGAGFGRTISRKRSVSRTLSMGGAMEAFPSEEAFAARLGSLGAGALVDRPILARAIVVPMQWIPMLDEQLGRPLRELILSVLPPQDVRPIIAQMMEAQGQELRATDPLGEAGAKKLLTAANALVSETKGALGLAREAARSVAAPAQMQAFDATAARSTVKAGEVWTAYDAAMERHGEREAARSAQSAAREDWRRRRAELGDMPALDTEALRVLEGKIAAAARSLQTASRDHQEAERLVARLHTALESRRSEHARLAAAGDACPTCQRPGWEQAAVRLAESIAAGKSARIEYDQAVAAEEVARDVVVRANAAHEALQSQRETYQDAEQSRGSWDRSIRMLGQEPQVSTPDPAPVAPTVPRPTAQAAAEALRLLREADGAEAARKAVERESERARAALERAERNADGAVAEQARVAALHDFAKRAPSELARRQEDAFGGLGPVSFRFPPRETKTTPEVELLIDGRPWWLASDGRRVVADLHLRAWLRERAALMMLPIIVDRAQDWSRDWPDVPGPVWYLSTTGDEGITVSSLGGA